MKIKQRLIAAMLFVTAAGAYADAGLTRAQVQQEQQTDFEIRQQLMAHREIALLAGCSLDAVSYDPQASATCNQLVQKIAASNGNDAAAKLTSYKAARERR